MRPVHDDGQASRPDFNVKALHAPRQTRGGARVRVEKRRAHRLPGARAHPLAAKLAQHSGCEREIDLLDRRQGVEARALHTRAEFVRSGLQDATGFVTRVECGDEHSARLEDPDLFPGDRRARGAQDFRMLERDVGDDCDLAIDDVGRIEPSAQADFDHRPLALRFGENDKGGGGEKVEPGGVGGRRAGLARGLVGVERPIQGAREGRLVDIVSLNANPLGDALNMGGGVAADTKASVRQRRLDQSRDRPFAFCARDMDRAKRLLRVTETSGEIPHRLEADPHRVSRPTLPVGECIEARHCSVKLPILSHSHHVGEGNRTSEPLNA